MTLKPHPVRDPSRRQRERRRPEAVPSARLAGCLFLALLATAGRLDARTRSIPFARLSTEQGLSQSTVNCVLQDATGFLWLGTQDGLNRYDGYGFTVYRHDPTDPSSLPSNWVEALALDPTGDLWVGTHGGGLARWRRATGAFERFRRDPQDPRSLPGDLIRTLHLDRFGALWVGTFQSGLARLDPGIGSFERFRHDPADAGSLADDRVRATYADSAGQLWVGTLGGLARLRPNGRAFDHWRHDPADPSSLSDDRVTSIAEHAGDLWVGTENGLHRRDSGTGRFARFGHDPADPASLDHDLVWSLLADGAGRLWIGTDGGLDLLGAGGDFARYRHDPADPRSLAPGPVASLLEDAGGVLWVGTHGGGVSKWNPNTWAFDHFAADPSGRAGPSSNAVFAFSENGDRRLWVGTFSGLDVLDRDGGDLTHYRHDPDDPASLAGDQIVALLHDRDGTLWAGVRGGGLARYDRAADGFSSFRHDPDDPASLGDDSVTALFEDSARALWVATFRGGLSRFDRASETFTNFRHDPQRPRSLSGDALTALAEGAGGRLWVGTFGSGLNRLERAAGSDADFLALRHEEGRPESLSSDTVYALHTDAEERLWVGTQVGLNLLAGPAPEASFRHWFARDGLAGDAVYGIEHDARGRLWIATGGGLSRFDPQAETFKSYHTSHGLQAEEFNFGAHYRSAGGELFFGGTGGFNAFLPEQITANAHVPPVVVTSVTVPGREIDLPAAGGEIRLGHHDVFFDLELAALDYTAPAENRYRYRLEGSGGGWVDLGHRRRVTFTHLDPGRYTLHVQGSNNDGVWNVEGARLTLVVAPPPWKSWWATSLYALAVAAVTGGLVRSRERKLSRERERHREREQHLAERGRLIDELEAKNAELERFNYTVSHDLKSPLITVHGFLGLLERDVTAGDAAAIARDMDRIREATTKMNQLLDELLELSRVGRVIGEPEAVPAVELAREAVELVGGRIEAGGVEVEVAAGLPVVHGDRRRLLEVFQNLVDNAVKFAAGRPKPRVAVGCRRDAEETVLYVEDNGIGIDPRYHERVFGLFERLDQAREGTGVGLALVKRIVELHGGRVWVESEGEGRGARFCFTLGEAAAGSAVS